MHEDCDEEDDIDVSDSEREEDREGEGNSDGELLVVDVVTPAKDDTVLLGVVGVRQRAVHVCDACMPESTDFRA